MGRPRTGRPVSGAAGTIFAAALLWAVALVSFSCSEDATNQPAGAAPSTLSFLLNDSTHVSFSGEASWPPSGSGVIARMDSGRTTLQVAAYTQTSGPAARSATGSTITYAIESAAGPEPRFDMVLLETSSSSGIAAGAHIPTVALFGRDLALHEVDSLGYFGVTGLFYLTSVTAGRVTGLFSGVAMRGTDSAMISIGGGNFDAAIGTGLLSFTPDTGSVGGTIAITVDTGATPHYSWSGGPVYALGVARASSPNALVWGIVTAGGDSIGTGVMHGQVPAGVARVANVEPVLTPGIAYRVTISRIGGAYGYREFTP
jgi:hypothetical protein